jgi:quinol monooxygenase YgiN
VIVEYIRYTIPRDRREAFERGYGEAQAALAASRHCLAYELARCVDDPTQYILRIEWDSAAGHMQGFRQSPGFRTFFAAVRPFVGDIAEMRHYERTAVLGRKDEQGGGRDATAAVSAG